MSAFEPGTADITTTDDPPFPIFCPPELPVRQTVVNAEYGWEIILTHIGERGRRDVIRAELMHPWLGQIGTAVYEL